MTVEELLQTIAWQANHLRVSEHVVGQLGEQGRALAERCKALEVENQALKERLDAAAVKPEGMN